MEASGADTGDTIGTTSAPPVFLGQVPAWVAAGATMVGATAVLFTGGRPTVIKLARFRLWDSDLLFLGTSLGTLSGTSYFLTRDTFLPRETVSGI